MKTNKLNYVNKLGLTLLCAFFLNAKGIAAESTCCDQDLLDTVKSNTRKAMPNIFGWASLSLGSSSFLKAVTTQAGNAIGIAGSSCNVAGALLNTYNWYVDREHIKGFAHNALNGMVVLTNIGSASLGFASVNSDNPDEKNAFGVASLIIGASGLLFKGIDLFLMPTPQEDLRLKRACAAMRRASAPDADLELGNAVTFHK